MSGIKVEVSLSRMKRLVSAWEKVSIIDNVSIQDENGKYLDKFFKELREKINKQ